MKVFEVMNSHPCVCVLNNLLLTCNNYDYNINSHFEKGGIIPKLFNYLTHYNLN
jgi:hypothetical protein